MEGAIALVTYIETHPGVAALLEVITIGCVIFVHRAGKKGRAMLHNKIEAQGEKLSQKLEKLDEDFGNHKEEDARGFGRIEGALGRIELGLNGRRPPPVSGG